MSGDSKRAEARRRRRRAALEDTATTVFLPIVCFILVLTIWEVWVRVGNVSPYVLPAPSQIARELGIFDQIWPDLKATLGRVLYGFLLSVGVGFAVALAMVTFRPVGRALYPLVLGTQVVPKIAIAPLFLVWFGYGGASTILIVFLIGFFPVVINTTAGLNSVETQKLQLASSIGAGWLATLLRIRLPTALPSIFGGLKLAALLSVSGAVVAEFISATSGIGRVIEEAAGNVDLVRLFVAVGYLAFFGLLFYAAIELLERLSIPWYVAQRKRMALPSTPDA